MSRRDYMLLAGAFASAYRRNTNLYDLSDVELGITVAQQCLAEALAGDNPRFDRARFDLACSLDGMEDS